MTRKKSLPIVRLKLEKIVGGGQTLGQVDYGKKIFVWGGLPGEDVSVQITKKKSNLLEGIVTEIHTASNERVEARDENSYLSTSPWQIMSEQSEQHYKSALIEEAFELHDILLPKAITIFSDDKIYNYRNKIEFSFYWDKELDRLDLAFFKRNTHSKIPVNGTSLAMEQINTVARNILEVLRSIDGIQAFMLKTLLIRCDQNGKTLAQLYVKKPDFEQISESKLDSLGIAGFELIFSNPKSPASVISERLQSWGETKLSDKILGIEFTYSVDGFFQINIPVYEQALSDMKIWLDPKKPIIDLYSGVGTIGLSIGGDNVTMIEINERAIDEMKQNINSLKRQRKVRAVLAPSESALDYISSESIVIVDPPRAGLHDDVILKLLEIKPTRIIYLSCNPVTQARDVKRLAQKYGIKHHQAYNFFPRTPHIEHLLILDLI